MNTPVEVYASSRGYKFGIYDKNRNHLNGWIEVSLGRAPIKLPFQAICSGHDSTSFNFCSFVHWSPYFEEITSVISGWYFQDHINLKWVMMTSSDNQNNPIISHGTDKLNKSISNYNSSSSNNQPVPHPFQLDMLNLASDLVKIETLHI